MRMIQCMADAEGLVLGSQKEVVRLAFAEIEYVEVINKTVFFYLVKVRYVRWFLLYRSLRMNFYPDRNF